MKTALTLALVFACAGVHAQQYKFEAPSEVQCAARPYCGERGRSCKPVEETYRGKTVGVAKDAIIRACAQANRPDRCNCVQQCRQVARCSKI